MITAIRNPKVAELERKLELASKRILELEAKLEILRPLVARAAGAMVATQRLYKFRNAAVEALIDKIRATYGT